MTSTGCTPCRFGFQVGGEESFAGGDAPHDGGHSWREALGEPVERKCASLDGTP